MTRQTTRCTTTGPSVLPGLPSLTFRFSLYSGLWVSFSKGHLMSRLMGGEFTPLLDKVGCVVIGNFQMDQHHLMSKVSYMVTKRRFVWNKTFLLGSIVWNKIILCFNSPLFIMFLYICEMPTKASNGIIMRCAMKLIVNNGKYYNFFTP